VSGREEIHPDQIGAKDHKSAADKYQKCPPAVIVNALQQIEAADNHGGI
jgi:hypothetical protein